MLWLFNIPNPCDASRIIDQVLDFWLQVDVEVGCGHEPTRSNLLKPGLWFAFDPSNNPQRYFDNAQYDWTPEELALVPNPYLLILVPIEFHAYLIPNKKIHTILLRNPNHAGSSDLRTFDEDPMHDKLKPGQLVVIVRDDSINGPYEIILGERGYPDQQFRVWNGLGPLTLNRPWNRKFRAGIFDFTKSEETN